MSSHTTPDVDVIVIGARIAGAITAGLLGMKGYRVLVLDRATFPSDTLSTHFFREPTFRSLEQLGVFEQVRALAPPLRMSRTRIDDHEFDEPVQFGGEDSFYLCVRRIVLDDALVRRLKSIDSVTMHEGATVDEFFSIGDTLAGVRWLEEGSRHEATARAIVGADGLHSALASHVQAKTETGMKVERMMYYAYFAGMEVSDPPAAEFHYRGNSLTYVFPTSDRLTLVALSLPISEFQEFKRDANRSFFEGIGRHENVAGRIRRAEIAGRVMGSGAIPSYQRLPYGNGWVLVGDSGQVMDPWSGQGMDQASTHAVLLAESLDSFLSGAQAWELAMGRFHERRNAFSRKAFERTTSNAADFRPMTQAALARRRLT